jgi:flagellar M-ring protein FliF
MACHAVTRRILQLNGHRMNLLSQLAPLSKRFMALGQMRIMAMLGGTALAIAMIVAAGLYLNKPTMETVYVGLEP